jgi:hypothetical protein
MAIMEELEHALRNGYGRYIRTITAGERDLGGYLVKEYILVQKRKRHEIGMMKPRIKEE